MKPIDFGTVTGLKSGKTSKVLVKKPKSKRPISDAVFIGVIGFGIWGVMRLTENIGFLNGCYAFRDAYETALKDTEALIEK